MISRRQIISRGAAVKQSRPQEAAATAEVRATSKSSRLQQATTTDNEKQRVKKLPSVTQQQASVKQQAFNDFARPPANFNSNDSSDGYTVNPYEEYGYVEEEDDDELLDDDDLEHDYEIGLDMTTNRTHYDEDDDYGDLQEYDDVEEHDYEDGELAAATCRELAAEDPYGRTGDFGGQRNFYWQQQQQANNNNLSSKQQLFSKKQQSSSKLASSNKSPVVKQRAKNPNKPLGPQANSSSGQSSSTSTSSGHLATSSSSNLQPATKKHQASNANQQQLASQQQQQQFDPYAIYAEEEEVWFSEERLMEDHMDEISNKWRLLDDDIWCKLIIMERNRRIGKAYARVPVVTIDGSHELSYDGFKLALNGFHNADRDSRTEECRRRIGKGIRIKMDSFGNILIKRLSKALVFVKEWQLAAGSGNNSPPNSLGDLQANSSAAVSSAAAAMSQQSADHGPSNTPSRQQVIKNQLNEMMNNSSSTARKHVPYRSHTSADSSSAICDDVLQVGGRLEPDKIYVMFDMKKFQANITQELCRPYPDRRKLEQQCFSIVGLVRDSEDVLNLPCWLMVINIVAIDMLNERFKLDQQQQSPFSKQPQFVSIFDQEQYQQQQHKQKQRTKQDNSSSTKTEEDPYSLPANASSSDGVKSSINDDYGTTSTKYQHIGHSRDYNTNKQRHLYADERNNAIAMRPPFGRLATSNHPLASRHPGATNSQAAMRNAASYNNSTSIYSPGHMLVLPPQALADGKPPKLPPRDFMTKMAKQQSNTTTTTSAKQDQAEAIYSVGLVGHEDSKEPSRVKSKKSRFLESLKAPLLSSSKSSSSKKLQASKQPESDQQLTNNNGDSVTDSVAVKKTSKNSLKSFLGVKSAASSGSSAANKADATGSGNSSKATGKQQAKKKPLNNNNTQEQAPEQADSVVDSQEEHSSQPSATSSSSSFNDDLDIPTPDYETDENIYAVGANNSKSTLASKGAPKTNYHRSKQQHKDDLYYSGGYSATAADQVPPGELLPSCCAETPDQAPVRSSRDTSRFMLHNKQSMMSSSSSSRPRRLTGGSTSASQLIYGSTLGLTGASSSQQQAGYRSTGSMQRCMSQQRFPVYSSSSAHSTSAAGGYQAAGFNQHKGVSSHYGAGKYASPLHPAQLSHIYNSHRFREDPSAIYGAGASDYSPYRMAGYAASSMLASSSSSQQQINGNLPRTNHYQAQQQHFLAQQQHRTRRRSLSRLGYLEQQQQQVFAGDCATPTCCQSNYDIGRSSSGIYGNNSSSSSSDYADWAPAMRKVNSSGYLNSIFKHHHLIAPKQQQQVSSKLALNDQNKNNADNIQDNVSNQNNNNNKNDDNSSDQQRAKKQEQVSGANCTTDNNKTRTNNRTKSAPSNHNNNNNTKLDNCTSTAANADSNYRLYESNSSSNDSYTNSSDGQDIYDRIGQQRLANNTSNHATGGGGARSQQLKQIIEANVASPHEFLATAAAVNQRRSQLAVDNQLGQQATIHVGEWENMYDR